MNGHPARSTDRSTETVDRTALAARTDGRTDVRTQRPITTATIMQLSDAQARVQADDESWVSLGDVLAAGIAGTGERFPVVRSGPREPIPYQLRAAVWLRDRGVCQKCYRREPKPWELDHIIPWSSGGPDVSTNLRILCEKCNQDRSNIDDGTSFAKGPVTWWCHRCYVDPVRWVHGWDGEIYCPTHKQRQARARSYSTCSVERVYQWQVEMGEKPKWHQRDPIEHFAHNAFCAHCRLPGLTDVTL